MPAPFERRHGPAPQTLPEPLPCPPASPRPRSLTRSPGCRRPMTHTVRPIPPTSSQRFWRRQARTRPWPLPISAAARGYSHGCLRPRRRRGRASMVWNPVTRCGRQRNDKRRRTSRSPTARAMPSIFPSTTAASIWSPPPRPPIGSTGHAFTPRPAVASARGRHRHRPEQAPVVGQHASGGLRDPA